jgi:aryl-alcohol dehydrogenase-like predicted oxidoreductase
MNEEGRMRYRVLGRTQIRVSEIGHGLWGMGDWSGSRDGHSLEALTASLAMGCNVFDSAGAYGRGRSDSLLGALVKASPGAVVVTGGKIPPKNWKWPGSPADRFSDVYPLEHVLASSEDSRARMNVAQLDLLQLHVWDDSWASDPEFHRVASTVKDRGLARAFGISLNRWEPWNGIEAISTGLVDSVQVIYNIFDQSPEDELFPACVKHNIGIIARVPLDEGSLNGSLTLDTRFPPDDWRARYFGPENLPETVRRVESLKEIAPSDMTLSELALRFILQNSAVSTTIVGMRSVAHVKANLAASDGKQLSSALMAELKKHRWDRKVTPWAN